MQLPPVAITGSVHVRRQGTGRLVTTIAVLFQVLIRRLL
jgi:hypothetical protein